MITFSEKACRGSETKRTDTVVFALRLLSLELLPSILSPRDRTVRQRAVTYSVESSMRPSRRVLGDMAEILLAQDIGWGGESVANDSSIRQHEGGRDALIVREKRQCNYKSRSEIIVIRQAGMKGVTKKIFPAHPKEVSVVVVLYAREQ